MRSFDIAPPRILTVTEACNEKSIKKTETAKQSMFDDTLQLKDHVRNVCRKASSAFATI